jgi:extradiol dioxygenase family protein
VGRMEPILHLSIPVRDLEEAQEFYVRTLGCTPARVGQGFVDVWFYGMQLTLQDRPAESGLDPAGSRHFGVTLSRPEFDAAVAHLRALPVQWLVPVSTDDEGLGTEQTKTKIADPSGNVIELKTYRDIEEALQIPRTDDAGPD